MIRKRIQDDRGVEKSLAMSKRNVSGDAVTRIARYLFIFWGVCVAAGAGLAVALAHEGMKPQDAFNSGLVVALIPLITVAIVGVIGFFF